MATHTARLVPARIERLGAGLLVGATTLLLAPAGPTLLALGLLLALFAVIDFDDRRPRPRFTQRRRLLSTARYRAWRAWDAERERWCILVRTAQLSSVHGASALADARRVLAVGPAYDADHDADGPLWIFEA